MLLRSVSAHTSDGPVLVPVVPRRWTFPAELEAVHRARRCVVAALADLHVPACPSAMADDVRLVVSELVTNAVRHGSVPGGEHQVELTLWPADGFLWLAVSDAEGSGVPERTAAPSADACCGRGLLLVDAVSDVRVVLPRPDIGKSVVVGLRLPPL